MFSDNSLRVVYFLTVLMSTCLLTVIFANETGEGTAVVIKEEDSTIEFSEVVFRGSIEPRIDEKMKSVKNYKICVFSRMGTVNEWSEPVEAKTDHEFSLNLHFHRHDREIYVWVMAQFKEYWRTEMRRSWLIRDPDFSLHYQLHVGVFEGNDYWLKGKMSLPHHDIKFLPEDEFEVSMGRTSSIIRHYSEGKKQSKYLHITKNGNVVSIAFKVDYKSVNRLLNNNTKQPNIKLFFKQHLFEEIKHKKKENKITALLNKLTLKKKERASKEKTTEITDGVSHKDEDINILPPNISGAVSEKTEIEKDVCPICFDEIMEGELEWRSNCNHHFHKQCIITWTKTHKECPVCRSIVRETYMLLLEDPVFSNDHYSFEYEFMISMPNGESSILQEFWGDMFTEEQKEFERSQYINSLNLLLLREDEKSYREKDDLPSFVGQRNQSRVLTLKVTRELRLTNEQ